MWVTFANILTISVAILMPGGAFLSTWLQRRRVSRRLTESSGRINGRPRASINAPHTPPVILKPPRRAPARVDLRAVQRIPGKCAPIARGAAAAEPGVPCLTSSASFVAVFKNQPHAQNGRARPRIADRADHRAQVLECARLEDLHRQQRCWPGRPRPGPPSGRTGRGTRWSIPVGCRPSSRVSSAWAGEAACERTAPPAKMGSKAHAQAGIAFAAFASTARRRISRAAASSIASGGGGHRQRCRVERLLPEIIHHLFRRSIRGDPAQQIVGWTCFQQAAQPAAQPQRVGDVQDAVCRPRPPPGWWRWRPGPPPGRLWRHRTTRSRSGSGGPWRRR